MEDLFALAISLRRFRAAMVECVRSRAGRCSKRVSRLAGMVDRRFRFDIDLFSRGGMRVLGKIRRQNYNVLAKRPQYCEGGARHCF